MQRLGFKNIYIIFLWFGVDSIMTSALSCLLSCRNMERKREMIFLRQYELLGGIFFHHSHDTLERISSVNQDECK